MASALFTFAPQTLRNCNALMAAITTFDHVSVSVPLGLLPRRLARVTVGGTTYVLIQQLTQQQIVHPGDADRLCGTDASTETVRTLVAAGVLQRNTSRAKLGKPATVCVFWVLRCRQGTAFQAWKVGSLELRWRPALTPLQPACPMFWRPPGAHPRCGARWRPPRAACPGW